jgi:hypothetical protein
MKPMRSTSDERQLKHSSPINIELRPTWQETSKLHEPDNSGAL